MQEDLIICASEINDFIFCPMSLYCHRFYDTKGDYVYKEPAQLDGTASHEKIDDLTYSTRKEILMSKEAYCEKYNIMCKIDTFNIKIGLLRETKRYLEKIYDGHIFQLYAQYFCLIELGYKISKMQIYSRMDNKVYDIKLPDEDDEMLKKFEYTLTQMRTFDIEKFLPTSNLKCSNCIYEPACFRSLKNDK